MPLHAYEHSTTAAFAPCCKQPAEPAAPRRHPPGRHPPGGHPPGRHPPKGLAPQPATQAADSRATASRPHPLPGREEKPPAPNKGTLRPAPEGRRRGSPQGLPVPLAAAPLERGPGQAAVRQRRRPHRVLLLGTVKHAQLAARPRVKHVQQELRTHSRRRGAVGCWGSTEQGLFSDAARPHRGGQ
jgi:hypothetical protein